jgi:hypothetical protein
MLVNVYTKMLSFVVTCVLYFHKIHQLNFLKYYYWLFGQNTTHRDNEGPLFLVNLNKNEDIEFYCSSNVSPNNLFQRRPRPFIFIICFDIQRFFT